MAHKINEEVCVGCGSCASACPMEAIAPAGDKYAVNADACVECYSCLIDARNKKAPRSAQGFLSRFPVRGQSSPFIIVKHCSISGRFDYPPVSPPSGKMSELWGGSYWSGDRRRHFPGIYT